MDPDSADRAEAAESASRERRPPEGMSVLEAKLSELHEMDLDDVLETLREGQSDVRFEEESAPIQVTVRVAAEQAK